MRTKIFSLALSLMVMLPAALFASGEPASPDTLALHTGGDPIITDPFALELDKDFAFQEKVWIHIYDINEKPLIDAAFTRQELKANKALKELLRKSTRFMSVNKHYYYIYYEG